MKKTNQILVAVGCLLLIVSSWLTVVGQESDIDYQQDLLEQAQALFVDGIYITAVPLLEEMVSLETELTVQGEEMLKEAYLELINQSGYSTKYIALLEKQMAREGVSQEPYVELYEYYFDVLGSYSKGLAVLSLGVERGISQELENIYEQERYRFKLSYDTYEEIGAYSDVGLLVKNQGYWGLISSSGSTVLPCVYDNLTQVSNGCAIVLREGEVYAVDSSGNRIALLKDQVDELGGFGDGIVTVKKGDTWSLASSSLVYLKEGIEDVGCFYNGVLAMQEAGKWGVIKADGEWMIEPNYDVIAQNEFGYVYAQNAVFAGKEGDLSLLAGGEVMATGIVDALPFGDAGYAAVFDGNQWGYMDTQGNLVIAYQFENAKSFDGHVAAVEIDGSWGFISLDGTVVIEPVYLDAMSFVEGFGAVKTAMGWQCMTLLEYV